ncbi:MAG: hypothetical protein JST54_11565 [Deltaproteobacteria bacterium]|nr:hypothetical protein [Deltaproteobacteria bacterium]
MSFQIGQVVNLNLDALYRMGGTGPFTYNSTNAQGSPTLPNKGLSLSSAGVLSGTVSGTAGANFTIAVAVTDSEAVPVTARDTTAATLTAAQQYTAEINLATYAASGIKIGGDTSVITRNEAANNLTLVNQAIAAMGNTPDNTTGDARVFFSANDSSGNPYTATNRAVILISGGAVTSSKLNVLDLPNVWFKVYDFEPMFAESAGPPRIMFIHGVKAPVLNVCLDGNGANQYPTNFGRQPSPTQNRWGYYSDGLYVLESGSSDGTPSANGGLTTVGGGTINGVKGNIVVKNTRGVTGNSGAGKGNHYVNATECFDMVLHGTFGGDSFTYQSYVDDGPYTQVSEDLGPPYNSGPKFHYTQLHTNSGASPISQLLVNIDSRRHGPGAFGGGRVQIMPGSVVNHCKNNYNFESGDAASLAASKYNTANQGPGVARTQAVILGDPNSNLYDQVMSTNATAVGFQCDGHDNGVATYDIYGGHSQGDKVVFNLIGFAPNHFHAWGVNAESPRAGVASLGSAANSAAFYVSAHGQNPSLEHRSASVPEVTGSPETQGQVTWTTY